MLNKWRNVNPIIKNKVYAVLSILVLMGLVKVFQLQEYVAMGVAIFFILLSNYFWKKSKKLSYKNVINKRKSQIKRLEDTEISDDEKEVETPSKKMKEVKRLK